MIQMFLNFSYFSTNLDFVYLCLPLLTFVQLTHLCTNFVLVSKMLGLLQCCIFKMVFLISGNFKNRVTITFGFNTPLKIKAKAHLPRMKCGAARSGGGTGRYYFVLC